MHGILLLYENIRRPHVLEALALWSAIIDGDVRRAEDYYQTAIDSINQDNKLDASVRTKWIASLQPTKETIELLRASEE